MPEVIVSKCQSCLLRAKLHAAGQGGGAWEKGCKACDAHGKQMDAAHQSTKSNNDAIIAKAAKKAKK